MEGCRVVLERRDRWVVCAPHDPCMYFPSILASPAQCANVLPLDRFFTDLTADRLPDFVWIAPNLDNDMHGGAEGGSAASRTWP